jgi:hypothetical protein
MSAFEVKKCTYPQKQADFALKTCVFATKTHTYLWSVQSQCSLHQEQHLPWVYFRAINILLKSHPRLTAPASPIREKKWTASTASSYPFEWCGSSQCNNLLCWLSFFISLFVNSISYRLLYIPIPFNSVRFNNSLYTCTVTDLSFFVKIVSFKLLYIPIQSNSKFCFSSFEWILVDCYWVEFNCKDNQL